MKYFLSTIFLCYVTVASAQAQLSSRIDPFAGINGSFLQPASNVSTPYDWDLNLLNLGVAFYNDYAYLKDASVIGLLRDANIDSNADVIESNQSWVLGNTLYSYDYVDRNQAHFGGLELDLLGPSFSVQLGEWTRVGLFSRARFAATSRDIESNFSYYTYDSLANGSTFRLSETFGAAAAWSEFGVHFSQAIPMGDDAELSIGVNARYLLPFEGGYFYNSGASTFGKLSVDSISIESGITDIAFTNILRDIDNAGSPSGNGFGLDVGARIDWDPLSRGGYRFSAGLSIIDAGILNFDRLSEQHRFSSDNLNIIESENFSFVEDEDDFEEVIGVLNDIFYGRRGASLINNTFSIGLPTAISAQFSYQPIKDLRFSAVYVGGVKVNTKQLRTGEQLALAANYSRWWYGVCLTTNLHDWRYLNIGGQLRLGPITIGSDRLLGTLLKASRFQASDFYLGIKLHNFGFGTKQSDRSSQFKRARNNRAVKCYKF